MKLATRIIAVILVVVALFTIAGSYFTVRSAHVEFRNQQAEVAQRVAMTMSELLIDAWRREGSSGVYRLLREGGPTRNLGLDVRWVWFEETAAAHERPRTSADEWPDRPMAEPFSILKTHESGQQRLYTYVPLRLAPGRRGGLEFMGSLAPLERQTWRVIRMALITIGCLALISAAVAYWTGIFWVARPLEALIAKTEQIGRGDFSQRLTLPQRDEFGELAVAINRMCDRLAEQQAAITTESAQRLTALEQLRHADRLKTVGRLAAGIAHELGTPLNVVAGRADLIASGRLGADDVQRSAQTIKSEADRITQIVRQLLDFARRRPPQRTVTDLHGLLTETAALLRPLAEKQNVRIEIAEPLGDVSASVDASQFQQVLTNMLVNAIQAMPDGGRVLAHCQAAVLEEQPAADAERGASLTSEPDRGSRPTMAEERSHGVLISIADEGTGIPPEDLDHLFEPFFTTKDVGEGTGLGLSIAYGIVQEHGGHIQVESQPGQGSRFTIYVPREDDGSQENDAPREGDGDQEHDLAQEEKP